MRIFILSIVAFLFSAPLFGQKGDVQFESTTFDFGEVTDWNNPAASFLFTNTGRKPVLFLPTFPKDDIFVELPKNSVQPGEAGEITVYYFTSHPGEFRKKIELYTNSSEEPVKLTVKGNILSLSENAFIECPGFAPKVQQDLTFVQDIKVIDKTTKEPIEEATVWLSQPGNEVKLKTKENGIVQEQLLPGLFDIMAEHYEYNSTSETHYINKQTGMIVMELEPVEPVMISYSLDDLKPDEPEEEDPAKVEKDEPIAEEDTMEFEDDLPTYYDEYEETPETEEEMPVEQEEEKDEPEAVTIKTENPPLDNELELPVESYSPNNIVFLIDVSSSMDKPDKLPLLQLSMKQLTDVLREIDMITVITYSSDAEIALKTTSASRKEEIKGIIDSLQTGGWTHGVKGIETAYDIIDQNLISEGNNQVILATDGLFNHPNYDQSKLFSLVRDKARDDIILSVIGFGHDKEAHKLMKKLASKGNGSFLQIEDRHAANEVLVEEIKFHSLKTDQ